MTFLLGASMASRIGPNNESKSFQKGSIAYDTRSSTSWNPIFMDCWKLSFQNIRIFRWKRLPVLTLRYLFNVVRSCISACVFGFHIFCFKLFLTLTNELQTWAYTLYSACGAQKHRLMVKGTLSFDTWEQEVIWCWRWNMKISREFIKNDVNAVV